jgi:hypothetical protein
MDCMLVGCPADNRGDVQTRLFGGAEEEVGRLVRISDVVMIQCVASSKWVRAGESDGGMRLLMTSVEWECCMVVGLKLAWLQIRLGYLGNARTGDHQIRLHLQSKSGESGRHERQTVQCDQRGQRFACFWPLPNDTSRREGGSKARARIKMKMLC